MRGNLLELRNCWSVHSPQNMKIEREIWTRKIGGKDSENWKILILLCWRLANVSICFLPPSNFTYRQSVDAVSHIPRAIELVFRTRQSWLHVGGVKLKRLEYAGLRWREKVASLYNPSRAGCCSERESHDTMILPHGSTAAANEKRLVNAFVLKRGEKIRQNHAWAKVRPVIDPMQTTLSFRT
jgi:hypothetical protein